jgi:hypothetical protein
VTFSVCDIFIFSVLAAIFVEKTLTLVWYSQHSKTGPFPVFKKSFLAGTGHLKNKPFQRKLSTTNHQETDPFEHENQIVSGSSNGTDFGRSLYMSF